MQLSECTSSRNEIDQSNRITRRSSTEASIEFDNNELIEECLHLMCLWARKVSILLDLQNACISVNEIKLIENGCF